MWTSTTAPMPAFWLCLSFLVSVVCSVPSLLPRGNSNGFTLNTLSNPNFAPNGTAAYLKAIAKYAHLVDDSTTNKAASPSGEVTGFAEVDDREWLCPVTIGTPGQTVNLDLDTGSADLWVFTSTSGSHAGDLGNRSVYNPEQSSSSKLQNGSSWMITYGDGSYASGKVYTDHVQVGDLNVKNANIETATRFSSNLVSGDAFLSGLMGLAMNLSTTIEPKKQLGILDQLSNQGVGSIAVDLQYHNNGTFTFGPVNESAYTGPITYQPVIADKGYWSIDMTTIRFGNSNETLIHSWETIVDTGTSLMLMGDSNLVADYYATVKSAEYSDGDYGYVFKCNETLPDFHFGFSDEWAEFTVPGTFMNYSVSPSAGYPWCYGGVQASNMGFSIMGDVFLKAVYVVFDMANKCVGFANKDLFL